MNKKRVRGCATLMVASEVTPEAKGCCTYVTIPNIFYHNPFPFALYY